jgi:hypothetical protein
MATMTSSKANGKNSRYVDEFKDRPVTVGQHSMSGDNKGLSLNFSSTADQYDENNKERNYSIRLNRQDTIAVIDTLIGNNFFLSDMWSPDPEGRGNLLNDVLAEAGIILKRYRLPYSKSMSFDGYLYVSAINLEHAIHKYNKVKLKFDPAFIEEVKPE